VRSIPSATSNCVSRPTAKRRRGRRPKGTTILCRQAFRPAWSLAGRAKNKTIEAGAAPALRAACETGRPGPCKSYWQALLRFPCRQSTPRGGAGEKRYGAHARRGLTHRGSPGLGGGAGPCPCGTAGRPRSETSGKGKGAAPRGATPSRVRRGRTTDRTRPGSDDVLGLEVFQFARGQAQPLGIYRGIVLAEQR
jgi:hypothetical protein